MTSPTTQVPIAVDAMGGDFAPAHVIAGALDALREGGERFSLLLVGPGDAIERELGQRRSDADAVRSRFTVVHAPEVIGMDEPPTAALKAKRNSSIGVGLTLQKEGKAAAFVSAGNTGAVLAASTLILGRLPGVSRPTIGALIPTARGRALLVDAGANVDCRPRHLLEFGIMGSVYVAAMLGTPRPRVGLLNVGEEEGKGNEASLEAFRLLRRAPVDFAGNVEGRDVLKGDVDVIVCDGFVGNILLKFGESVPAFLKAKLTQFASRTMRGKLIGLVARGGLRSVMRELDYQEHGGVPLLGVHGVSIIGHGGSTPRAIKNMIFRAEEMVHRNVQPRIQEEMARCAPEP